MRATYQLLIATAIFIALMGALPASAQSSQESYINELTGDTLTLEAPADWSIVAEPTRSFSFTAPDAAYILDLQTVPYTDVLDQIGFTSDVSPLSLLEILLQGFAEDALLSDGIEAFVIGDTIFQEFIVDQPLLISDGGEAPASMPGRAALGFVTLQDGNVFLYQSVSSDVDNFDDLHNEALMALGTATFSYGELENEAAQLPSTDIMLELETIELPEIGVILDVPADWSIEAQTAPDGFIISIESTDADYQQQISAIAVPALEADQTLQSYAVDAVTMALESGLDAESVILEQSDITTTGTEDQFMVEATVSYTLNDVEHTAIISMLPVNASLLALSDTRVTLTNGEQVAASTREISTQILNSISIVE